MRLPNRNGKLPPTAKGTYEEAQQIRIDYKSGMSRQELAEKYTKFSYVAICNIINNKSYFRPEDQS